MRPLPNLVDLPPSPSIFQQPGDDWNSIFADTFLSIDSNQAAADAEIETVQAGMNPLSDAIDAVGGALDLATEVLGLLSGDLDLVDLSPQISNYMAADQALDSNISDPIFDLSGALEAFGNFAATIFAYIYNAIISVVGGIVNSIESAIESLYSEFAYLTSAG